MPLYVSLEGPHGAGKSTMADELADALTRAGIDAIAFHHFSVGDIRTAWQQALHYAAQRAFLAAAHQRYPDAPRVVVCDRWTLSTWVEAARDPDLRTAAPYFNLVHAEDQMLPSVRYVILDASPHVLAERIAARGEPIDPHADEIRAHYLAAAKDDGWPIVDTSQPRDAVLAQLVEIVRGWL